MSNTGLCRVALYIRVSTEEQAIKGLSPDAQHEALIAYAKKNNYIIVDTYIDEGKTARKKLSHRKEFQRLIQDVQQDKIDLVLVTKLDRWFRNVADYHATQSILESHGCNWKTTKENYDTTTASGRLHINIMLSVAQDEADRTSERIKAVFDYKLNHNEVITGALPIGFKIVDKHLEIDNDTVYIVHALFERFEMYVSARAAMLYLRDEMCQNICYNTIMKMLSNPLYKGQYRDNTNYCPAIIEPERFDRVQKLLNKNGKVRHNKRSYIFSGLLVCKTCGRKMTATTNTNKRNDKEYHYSYYRCNFAHVQHSCTFKKLISENKLERTLIQTVKPALRNYIASFDVHSTAAPVKKNTTKIKSKLKKLKELYVNDLIDMDEYKKDYEMYTAQLEACTPAPAPVHDLSSLKSFLDDTDIFELYKTFSMQEKRTFWLSIIDCIIVDESGNFEIKFL